MKKIFFILIFGIYLIGFTSAITFCIDHIPPSAPSNLTVSGEVGNIVLIWSSATDEPDCSGIDYYNVSRDGKVIGEFIKELNFTDFNSSLRVGNYTYMVFAVDKVGHNKGDSIINQIELKKENGKKVVHRGGGGSSYICEPNWKCSGWNCIDDDVMTRKCTDINNCSYSYNKPIETTGCTNETQNNNILNQKPLKEKRFFPGLTGAVIGGITDFAKSGTGAFVFIILIVGATGLIIIKLYRLRRRKS